MSKWSITGGLFCIAGLLLLGFQALSSLTGQEGQWKSLCLYDVVNPEHLEWIDKLSWLGMDRAADYIAASPLYVLLLIVGGILVIISGFIKN
ncbi:MAG: hypothetical protein RBT11_04220 [Desulfobacterales bacterium]|jgi:hypothetical protein|nr:hypothetical protein [Desulfobacterales bacterium]